tara:strand:- start:1170 stop:1613 length:444 start_codon:yes stop_codon:yes gene_type:complete
MIVRRCSQGHHVRIYRNTTKGVTRVKTYSDGSTETLAYPSSYNYFVDVDGKIVKKSNSFKTIENFYVDECEKKHESGHGRIVIGTHFLINGVATSQLDFPSNSNTKAEIKDFYDKRNISYGSGETKAELLSRIVVNAETGDSKHLKR